jgi:hypothetical protein
MTIGSDYSIRSIAALFRLSDSFFYQKASNLDRKVRAKYSTP